MIAAGIIGGLLSAGFGLVDWFGIPPSRARGIGALHGVGNVVVVVLFAASWFMRRGAIDHPAGVAFVFSYPGAGLAMITGWLGGELVDRLSIGVDEGAHIDAPSSLSGPAVRAGGR